MTQPWTDARHVLCVRLDAPGDVLMCTPALRALRAQHPDRRLTLLASPPGAALAPYLDDVDAAIAWEAPWTQGSAALRPERERDWIATLAGQGFDAAVIFTCYTQSALPAALLCQLAGIPLRLGYCRENPYQLLSDWIADPEPGAMMRHAVQRQLDLVRHVGAELADERLAFTPAPADIDMVRGRLRQTGIDPDGRWLVLHPGAGALARRYPLQHWQSLVRELGARVNCPLVFAGAAHEAALVDRMRGSDCARLPSFTAQLHIGELGALLSQASLVVSNSSGPAQLAAAVGTPVVSLNAPADPLHAPWRVASRVLHQDCRHGEHCACQPGEHGCLEKLAPSRVVDAVCSLLKQTEPYRRKEVRMS